MKTTKIKCNCDNCNKEMTEFEYENALEIMIKAHLPNPKGGCRQMAAIDIKLCDECSEKIGIINKEEYHDFMYSQNRLTSVINKYKEKILKLCFGKKH